MQGYVATSTDEIVHRVGMTRGALYHHFRDKAALFAAVYREQRDALASTLTTRMQAAEDASEQQVMLTVCQTFIDEATDPRVRRILFVDGPAVLQPQVLREPEPVRLLLRQVFEPWGTEGGIDRLPLDLLVHLIWALCYEAGCYIAQAEERAGTRQEVVDMLERLLSGLGRPGG